MTLRTYCEQMGMKLERWTVPGAPDLRGEHVRIADFEVLIDGASVQTETRGATRADADAELLRLIVGRILRQISRPTTLYSVPKLDKP